MAGYLPSSGSLAMSTINSVFDGRGNNLNAYRGTTWYTAAGGSGTFSSGAISFNDFYNKGPSPARTFSLASMVDVDGVAFPPASAYAEWVFYADGTMGYFSSNGSSSMGNWTTPTTAGIGSSYWIRVTETYSTGGFTITGSGRGIWNQLNVAQYFGISRDLGGYGQSINTIEISTNSSGTNIVATRTGMNLIAEVIF